jgi:sugar lactone lactonase YvrE
MKEPVRKTRHPYVVGACIAAIAGAYFYLVADKTQFPEPGPNLVYNIKKFEDVDNVSTRYKEATPIVPELELPKAMEVDGAGNLYVAGKNAIAVYNSAGAETSRITIDGAAGCLEFTPDGRLLVGMGDRVAVLDGERKTVATWSGFAERTLITSIAANSEEVYLADAANRCVLRVDYDGKVLNQIGKADESKDIPGLEVPSPYFDMAFDDEGALWVVNPGKLGLESYRSNGDIVTSWYRPSLELDGFSGCCNPTHIAFNSAGRLVTCEKGLVRVKIYEVTAGSFEELVVGSKAFKVAQSVSDMVVDSADRVLVLDSRQKSVRIFEPEGPAVAKRMP